MGSKGFLTADINFEAVMSISIHKTGAAFILYMEARHKRLLTISYLKHHETAADVGNSGCSMPGRDYEASGAIQRVTNTLVGYSDSSGHQALH